jgi:hypothetical protein
MTELQNASLKAHRGVMILVFGILGLVICFPFGIAAWVMGNHDLKAIRAGQMDPLGEGLTQGGRIVGMIATILAAVGLLICLAIAAVAVLGALGAAHH